MTTKHSLRVVWTKTAVNDHEEIVDLIADDSTYVAGDIIRICERAINLNNIPTKAGPCLNFSVWHLYRELILRVCFSGIVGTSAGAIEQGLNFFSMGNSKFRQFLKRKFQKSENTAHSSAPLPSTPQRWVWDLRPGLERGRSRS